MVDLQKIYADSVKELAQLKQDRAVLQSKIAASAKALGVDPTVEAIQAKLDSLTSEKLVLETRLETLTNSLEDVEKESEKEFE